MEILTPFLFPQINLPKIKLRVENLETCFAIGFKDEPYKKKMNLTRNSLIR